MKEVNYWPKKTDFVREAVVQKVERYKKELQKRKAVDETASEGNG